MRLVTLVTVACASAAFSNDGAWTTAARLPEPLQELSAATLKGRIYTVGGINTRNEATKLIYRYDPATDRWDKLRDLPDYRHHMPLVVLNDTLIAIGGYAPPTFTPVRSVLAYDETHDMWIGRALLPEPRGASAAAVVDGKIVLVGGTGRDGKHVDSIAIYDPVTDTWRHGAPIPTPRDHLTAQTVNGIVYAIGGRRGENFDLVEAYDLKTDRWTKRASMPSARGGLGSVALAGSIYTYGGERASHQGDAGVFDNQERYDPATDRWTTLPSLPTPRHGLGVTALDGRIYVIGGGPRTGFAQTDVVEVFTP